MMRRIWIPVAILVAVAAWLSDKTPQAGVARPISIANITVVDGDTIRLLGERIRLTGYDTPETFRAQCDAELQRGNAATARLRALLQQADSVELDEQDRRDRHGRILARLMLDGRDVADVMISEKLARRYNGGQRQSWC
jgi:endonuclease YncB( thermonuclease family)